MRLEQEKVDIWLFKLLFLLSGGILVTQILGLENITSYLFLLTFPLTVLLWARTVRQTLTIWDLLILLTIGMAVISVLINTSFAGTKPSFSYFKKFIMFSMTLLYLQACSRTQLSEKLERFFKRLTECVVIYLILAFFFMREAVFRFEEWSSVYLTFGLGNPNLAGLFVSCLYMLEFPRLFQREKWHYKALQITLTVVLSIFTVMTGSRNSIIVILLYTVCCVVLLFVRRRWIGMIRFGWIPTIVVILIPLLFMAAYMVLVYNESVQEAFSFITGKGKDLDSRVEIWEPALQNLARSPIVGAYSQISNGTGAAQMHNTHLDIACSYGIPVLVMVCVLLFRWLNQRNQTYESKTGIAYMLGFACAIIMGMGEAALFSGSLGLYILVGGFLLLGNQDAKIEPLVEFTS